MQKVLTHRSTLKKYINCVIVFFLECCLGRLLKGLGFSHKVFLPWWIVVVYGGSV